MEALTDWYELWRKLSDIQSRAFSEKKKNPKDDFWKHKARDFDKMVEERWSKPDSSRDFLIQKLKDTPGATLLDIGAGTGKWSILAAPYASRVTAVEPSSAMREVLDEKIRDQGITNIDVMDSNWPEDDVPPHDYVLASHSMYGVGDFKAFAQKMNDTATRGCIMVLRAVFMNSVMAEAARRIFGQPYDSPNFQIAYNALLGMDIFPDVIMEADGTWPAWKHNSLADAFEETRNRLGLSENSDDDDFLMDLLKQNLTESKGEYVWPKGNRSALVYWDVS